MSLKSWILTIFFFFKKQKMSGEEDLSKNKS